MIESRTFKIGDIKATKDVVGKYIMVYLDGVHLPAKVLGFLPKNVIEVEILSGKDKGHAFSTFCFDESEIKVYDEDQLILLLLD